MLNPLALMGLSEIFIVVCLGVFVLSILGAFMWMEKERGRKRDALLVQTMTPGPVGFVVLYRWRLVPGREEEFRVAWERLTKAIRAQRGGLGSRLHRGVDGIWWAYAQWPTEERWRTSMASGSVDDEAASQMGETVLDRFDPIPLTLIADLASAPAVIEVVPA